VVARRTAVELDCPGRGLEECFFHWRCPLTIEVGSRQVRTRYRPVRLMSQYQKVKMYICIDIHRDFSFVLMECIDNWYIQRIGESSLETPNGAVIVVGIALFDLHVVKRYTLE